MPPLRKNIDGITLSRRAEPLARVRLVRPIRRPHPWLTRLRQVQQVTTGLAIVSCLSTLGLYSWTVFTQQHWSKQYSALERMRRNERQYLLTQTSMANALRMTAERSDMVALVPNRMIEVPIAEPRPVPPQIQDSMARSTFFPVGY